MLAIEAVEKINRNTLGSVTVLSGEDIRQYQLVKELLLKNIGFDSNDLTLTYMDLSQSNYDQLELELRSLPFFSDEKIVVVDYFWDLTTDKKRTLTDEELKQFEIYLSSPNETTRLVLLAPGKLDSKRRIVKRLKRDALCIETKIAKEAEVKHYFQKEIYKKGFVLAPPVFDQLLARSNADFSEMAKNLAFLESYKPGGEITSEDILQAIPKTLQDNVFDLSQRILAQNIHQVQELVADLRLQGEEEIKLIAILLNQFRMFLQVQLLAQEGQSEQQIVTRLSDYQGRAVNPYQVKFALRDSRGVSISFLEEAVCSLIEADYQIKTGQLEKEYALDICLLKLMRIKQ